MKRAFYIILFVAMAATMAFAQNAGRRFVTPVEKSTNRTLLPRKGEKLEYIERDSLVLDSLRRDSIAKIYPKYPLITDITVGANIWDGVAKLFGQSYQSYDVSVSVNMWNRLFPTLELGVGSAKNTPDGLNYSYRTPLSFYAKLGANYNFMFKSHPKYQLFAGARVGYTSFKYDVTNVAVSNGYWGENLTLEMRDQKSNALYGELLLGLKVNLFGPISAGWTFKYHNLFNYKKNSNSHPWYIPGYGTRNSSIYLGLSVYYTIPMSKKKWPKIDENGKLLDPSQIVPTDSVGTTISNGEIAEPSRGSGNDDKAVKAESEGKESIEESQPAIRHRDRRKVTTKNTEQDSTSTTESIKVATVKREE